MPTTKSFTEFLLTTNPELRADSFEVPASALKVPMMPLAKARPDALVDELVLVEDGEGPVLWYPRTIAELVAAQRSVEGDISLTRLGAWEDSKIEGLEERILAWRGAHLGLRQVSTDESLEDGGPVAQPEAGERSLLLLHGIFSHAGSAFKGLATRSFFRWLRSIYGNRIYAFNHLTASQTIATSAGELLAALPAEETTYDVIAHSRGGLVLRAIVEGAPGVSDDMRQRFALGKAVLACVPNHGTKIVTDSGFELLLKALGKDTTLFRLMFRYLKNIRGSMPGLADMNLGSPFLEGLNATKPRPSGRYAAVAADFEPRLNIVDPQLDALHGEANDRAVSTRKSALVGNSTIAKTLVFSRRPLPGWGERVDEGGVWHTEVFEEEATRSFIRDVLS